VSIKQLFALASALVVLLVAGSAALSLYVAASAQLRLEGALRSYEQLSIATGLEADAARTLLAELHARTGGAPDAGLGVDAGAVAARIDDLVARTREEISSTDDAEEQAREAQEFVAASALRQAYASLLHSLETPRAGAAALGEDSLDTYRDLGIALAAILRDERGEVLARSRDLDAFRGRVALYAGASVLLAALGVIIATLLVYRFLMRPLRRLEAGSLELAGGNIAHRIRPLGPPELRHVATHLNDMAERIEEQRRALSASRDRLEELVAERTAELAEKAERLQAIDASRRLFFAKVGHELRTPLAVLLGEAEVALQGRDGDPAQLVEACEHILLHGEQLRRRVADLLALARAEDGRLAMERQPVDLVDLSRRTVASAQAYARVQDVQLELLATDDACIAEGDADRLRQALMALIDNAVRHAPAGSTVELCVATHAGEGRLSVADRGPGVDEAELPRITEPYFQAGEGSGRGAMGLGLAVAQWVARGHGGRLEAANRVGGGLEVALRLPAGAPRTSG
jgi:signal transduction histidine kinase